MSERISKNCPFCQQPRLVCAETSLAVTFACGTTKSRDDAKLQNWTFVRGPRCYAAERGPTAVKLAGKAVERVKG
jgi:hypothetical protein